jgi:hypothetical protein
MSGAARQFEEHIGGRTFHIEVSQVIGTPTRWRAQIRRAAGMPTAMMPFYGPTPDEAAQGLSRWLTLVYSQAATQN